MKLEQNLTDTALYCKIIYWWNFNIGDYTMVLKYQKYIRKKKNLKREGIKKTG